MMACLLVATASVAQDGGASTAGSLVPGVAGSSAEAQAPVSGEGLSQARALIEVLRDDTARAALLDELERLVAADGTAASPAQTPATAPTGQGEAAGGSEPATERPTLGGRLAALTGEAASDARRTVFAFADGLAATGRRLAVLWSPQITSLYGPLNGVAVILLVTVGTYTVTRWLSQRGYQALSRRLDRMGVGGRLLLGAGSVSLDALAVLAAYIAGQAVLPESNVGVTSRTLAQTYYLNAFALVGIFKVVLGLLLAPRRARIRLLPLSDGAARFWRKNLVGIAVLLVYGQMLAVPMISTMLSIFTGRAVAVVVLGTALLWSMVLVIRHRHAPRLWLEKRAEETGVSDATTRMTLALVSAWHWPAVVYLLVLFVMAVSDTGDVGPFARNSLEVVGVLTVGGVLISLLSRAARRGITLPQSITESLPMLETRVNGFFRSVLGTLRLILFIGTMLTAIQVAGFSNLPIVLTAFFGRDIGAAALSVGVIVLVAFMLWLALASFVDFRLNPDRGMPPTARETTLLTLLRNAATIALVIITTMISLSELGIDIAPLLASAGVLGLAIGFGAQKLVQDIITGVFIQLENAFNVGDVVTVGGTTGVVERLTIRSVSLRDLQGVFHIIPFSSVDMVSNFMRDFAFHVADIGIAYRENVDEAKEQMLKAFDDLRDIPEHGRVIIGPLEWMGLQALGDSAVVLRARIRTRPGNQWAVGRAYNEAIKKRFDAVGIEIPFPHTTIWFGEDKNGKAPPIHVAQPSGGQLASAAE
jgi:small conductance mechanosensitive channel